MKFMKEKISKFVYRYAYVRKFLYMRLVISSFASGSVTFGSFGSVVPAPVGCITLFITLFFIVCNVVAELFLSIKNM